MDERLRDTGKRQRKTKTGREIQGETQGNRRTKKRRKGWWEVDRQDIEERDSERHRRRKKE